MNEGVRAERTCEVFEVSLFLSAGQMYALEEAAHDRGLTAAEMFRQLLHDFIATPHLTDSSAMM
jgi:hypothetical protein